MNKEEELFDWRLQAVSKLAKDSIISWKKHNKWEYLVVIWSFWLRWKNINFDMPNFCALYLDMANNYFNEIDSSYFTFKNFKSLRPKKHNILFTLIQNRISNIIFSFLWLESFINDAINFIDNYDKNYRYYYFNKEWKKIEKWIKFIVWKFTLEMKLKVIYDFYDIKEDEEIKKDIMKIKKLRDKLIHFNPHIQNPYKSWNKIIWNDLLDINFINYSVFTNNIIWYFIEESLDDRPISQYWYSRSDNCFKNI